MKTFDRRVVSIDLVRGLIMILMTLDHTRDFFSSADFNPLDLQKTDASLFLTRWITHYCAPLFIFLSGVSSFLSLSRGGDVALQSRLLFMRGTLLILLELTFVHWFGWTFSIDMREIWVGVLWAIGWSMLCLGGLVHLRREVAGAVGIVMILGHNLFDGVRPEQWGGWGWLWQILHAGSAFEFGEGRRFIASYPLIPWIGVMALGYAVGPVFVADPASRRRTLLRWGAVLSVAFVLLRLGNLYGDATVWSRQTSDLFTLFSFIKCTKYPPSLHYLLMTLGPGLILLALLDRPIPTWLQWINVYGQVPLFFYLLHLPLIHGLAVLTDYGRYGAFDWQFGWPFAPEELAKPADHGFGLLIVYLMAAFVVLLLYPLCRWFAGLKRTSRQLWVRLL